MLQPKIQRTYLVELNLPQIGVNGRANFQYVAEIDQIAEVYALETFIITDLSTSPNQKQVVNATGAANIVVTLVVGDDEQVFQYPYLDLRPGGNSGLIRCFTPKRVNLTKSYITMFGTGGLTANESLMFNFIFTNSGK